MLQVLLIMCSRNYYLIHKNDISHLPNISNIREELRKINRQTTVKLTLFILVGIVFLYDYSITSQDEGFAIYLTTDEVAPSKIPVLSHIEISEQPIISTNDIIKYNAKTHEITISAEAFNRIANLEVPVTGRSFAVCVDKKTIYCGAFWTPISSISFEGVVIWKPLNFQDSKIIKLELGYPSQTFYGGDDPRTSPEIMKSLTKAGKLITGASYMEMELLPHSMKGYELFSWKQNNQWHFTLTTGTNRYKTIEEIASTTNIITQDGWVHLHVVGVEEINNILSRLPRSEDILWLSKLHIEQTERQKFTITLPEETIIDMVKLHSERCGLTLKIQTIA
jgi:hypothetical protein